MNEDMMIKKEYHRKIRRWFISCFVPILVSVLILTLAVIKTMLKVSWIKQDEYTLWIFGIIIFIPSSIFLLIALKVRQRLIFKIHKSDITCLYIWNGQIISVKNFDEVLAGKTDEDYNLSTLLSSKNGIRSHEKRPLSGFILSVKQSIYYFVPDILETVTVHPSS